MRTRKVIESIEIKRQGRLAMWITLLVALIGVLGGILIPYIQDNIEQGHAHETQTANAKDYVQATEAKQTEIAGYTVTSTFTPTSTPIEAFTPTPPIVLSTIPSRPIDEITYCQDVLHPAGIRVIARWPTQHKRGLYIAAQKSMGIVGFRVAGWEYLPSTQINTFPYAGDFDICGYDAQWLAWTDSKSIDPSPGSIITIEFLNANGNIMVTLTLSVNRDGLGLTHINLEQGEK